MIHEAWYEENLPSANYKTRHFGRKITANMPEEDAKDKEKVVAFSNRLGAMVQHLVKADIAAATAAIEKAEAEEQQ